MLNDLTGSAFTPQAAQDLLKELEANTPEQIRQQRSDQRVVVNTSVEIQPGNTSDRARFKYRGALGDISSGGCRILVPMPLLAGDVYRLHFVRSELNLPETFCRCTRCVMVRDDAFEVGMRFFAPIIVPQPGGNSGAGSASLL